MSALLAEPRFTAQEWASMMESAEMTDQGYRDLPGFGRLAATYVDELAFEEYSTNSIVNREPVLRMLAIDFVGRDPATVTVQELKAFLARHWSDSSGGTKANRTTHVRTFFAWLYDNDHIPANPASKIRTPRSPETHRQSREHEVIQQLVRAQPNQADGLALEVMYWLAARRSELREIQFLHFNYRDLTVIVHGKGRKIVEQRVPGDLAARVEAFQRERGLEPTDYLLHAQRVNKAGRVMWFRPAQPMSDSGVYRWWQRCLLRAGIPYFPMHEMRHSAGTHFYKASGGDLIGTQEFMRHADPGVTAKTYVHIDRAARVADVQRLMEPLA